MLLLSLLHILAKNQTKQFNESQFQDRLSLMHPHVGDNGRNDFYVFDGQFLITTRSRVDSTQLGYTYPQTSGIIQMKEPIKKKDFRFEIEFNIDPLQGGDGYGFWISDQITKGAFYGRDKTSKE